jgi:anaerobic ribonucleoside-triphosphate reductase activating protein
MRRFKAECPGKDVWAYTGYLLDEELAPGGKNYTEYTDELLSYIDVLVDGPFILEQKSLSLKFKGSRNQRVIDMNESRKTNRIVELEL